VGIQPPPVIPAKAGIQYLLVIPAKAGIQHSEKTMKQPTVYLMASQRNGTLYVGVTSDLIKRIWQHRNHVVDGFTDKYHVELLVWFEQHESMVSAIGREKAIKKWNRAWKLNLIEKTNPDWQDLWPVITGEALDSRLRGNDEEARE
jgi:putative endonuclease